jgi:hypothetical protein
VPAQSPRRTQHDVTALERVIAADVDEVHVVLRGRGRRRAHRGRVDFDVVLVDLDALGGEPVGDQHVAEHR